ncbi:MAG: ABC transporter ATP-binding protein [Candidatus Eremiobacteraeota bacterium]|nr:ABC transporter ATP-binding protein [Candidatus Eremiobacteraeota bacterium]
MTATVEPAIAVSALVKRYPTGTVALDDIDFTAGAGEFVSVVGPSGCGKTTLLRILAGLEGPTAGLVQIAARNATSALPAATVFQEESLFPWMRVDENVAIAFDGLAVSACDARRRSAAQLELVGLTAFSRAFPHELSGGMKQRVAVARAFAVDAPVLLMDEPFGALDEQTRVALAADLMALWSRAGNTVVFVTHSIEEAVTLGDRVVVLSKSPGRVLETIEVGIPRPRDAIKIRSLPRFVELTQRVWDLLR